MKIIITEEQLFTLKSLNGAKFYVEEHLSQFEHFLNNNDIYKTNIL